MHPLARRALVWRRSNGKAFRCFASASSPSGSVNVGKSRQSTKLAGNFSCEPSSEAALSDKFGFDTIHKPPLQSLHKAILAGEVSLPPSQKVRKNGKVITTFNVATGGMWKLPTQGKVCASEDECTDPCLQYHKVAIHDLGLGNLAVRTLRKGLHLWRGDLAAFLVLFGTVLLAVFCYNNVFWYRRRGYVIPKDSMQVYVEGELETRVFNDMETGVIKRDREIAVHASGQIMAWTDKGPVSIESQ